MNNEFIAADQLIADRFLLTEAAPSSYEKYGVSTWRATDTVLSRELRAIVIPPDHPHRAAAIDAGRRAGLFDDPHVTAVLGVINNNHDSVIFTEIPVGEALTPYVTEKPLPPATVTAIIGETAAAVNHARHRGLRHLQLSTDHLYLADTGDLMLDGVAIMAAFAGANTDEMSAKLDRDETRGIIVFFAALLAGEDFPADPNTHQDFIYRAAQRDDLPPRVRELFAAELNGTGAQSPADLMAQLVPWGDIDIVGIPLLAAHFAVEQAEKASAAAAYAKDAAKAKAKAPAKPPREEPEEIDWANTFEPVTAEEIFTTVDGVYEEPMPFPSFFGKEGVVLPLMKPAPTAKATTAEDAGQLPDAADTGAASEPSSPALPPALGDEPPRYTIKPDTPDTAAESDSASEANDNSANDNSADAPATPQEAAAEFDSLVASESERHAAAAPAASSADSTAAEASTAATPQPDADSESAPKLGLEAASALAPRNWHTPSDELLSAGGKNYSVPLIVLVIFAIAALLALVISTIKLFAPLDPVHVTPPDSKTASIVLPYSPANDWAGRVGNIAPAAWEISRRQHSECVTMRVTHKFSCPNQHA